MDNQAGNRSARMADTRNAQRRARNRLRRADLPPERQDEDSRSLLPNLRGLIAGVYPAQSHLQRHRMRRRSEHDGFGTVQETIDDLDNVQRTTQMNASALDQTLPVPAEADEFAGLEDNTDGFGRRNKRRKLGAASLDAVPKISYGYHGQVAPTRLKMMISYCDGGQLHEDRQYSQENVLQNDKSVYCSRKSKVNLMLSHLGLIPFTCTKIVIKTPESGFPAPIQEGMVFIFMQENGVLEDTSQFQLQDWCTATHPGATPPPERPRLRTRLRMSNGQWLIDESERERALNPAATYRTGLSPYGLGPFFEETQQSYRPETSYSQDDLPQLARMTHQVTPLSGTSAYERHILVSCDPPSDDDEDATPDAVLEDRRRRAPQADSEGSDEDEETLQYTSSNRTGRQRPFSRAIIWAGKDPASSSSSSSDDPRPPGPNVPYVRFFIERKKHVVSIKFDPPVSGKYVLLKLWSPHARNSLDLQSVCVYGFAGPRFFPVLKTQ